MRRFPPTANKEYLLAFLNPEFSPIMKAALLLFFLFSAGRGMAQKISRAHALADMQFLNEAVVKGHPVNYNGTRQVTLDSLIAVLQNRKEDSLESQVFTQLLGRALQKVGDVHTYIVKNPLAKPIARFFPERLFLQDKALYLSGSPTDSGKRPRWILRINKVPAKELIAAFSILRPADGGTTVFSEQYFNIYPQHFVSRYFNSPDIYEVEVMIREEENKQNRPLQNRPLSIGGDYVSLIDSSYIVKAVKELPAGKETLPPKEVLFSNGANRFRTVDSVGILQMQSFAKSDASFLDRTFEYLRLHKTKGLIVDLRNNTGGNRNAAVQLTRDLVSGPFSYAILQPKNLHPKKYLTPKGKRLYLLSKLKYNVGDVLKGRKTPLGRQFTYNYTGSKNPFRGKLVVLTNGFTSSSATMVTSWLKQHRQVTFRGSQAGGGYNGNSGGSFPTIRLPHSGVEINFPVYRLILDATSAQYSGIEPEEGGTDLLKDAKTGGDGVLEEALEQLRED